MDLLHEHLALAHLRQRVQAAQENERRHRLVAALKARRRAERAALRARLLLARTR